MSDTPRTDERVVSGPLEVNQDYRYMTDFARQLERELAEEVSTSRALQSELDRVNAEARCVGATLSEEAEKTALSPREPFAKVAVEGTYLSNAAANHLRRLVAWVRCDVGQSPEELVNTIKEIAPAIGEISEEAKQLLVLAHREATAVPQYVRAAIRALEKSIAGIPDERNSERQDK